MMIMMDNDYWMINKYLYRESSWNVMMNLGRSSSLYIDYEYIRTHPSHSLCGPYEIVSASELVWDGRVRYP